MNEKSRSTSLIVWGSPGLKEKQTKATLAAFWNYFLPWRTLKEKEDRKSFGSAAACLSTWSFQSHHQQRSREREREKPSLVSCPRNEDIPRRKRRRRRSYFHMKREIFFCLKKRGRTISLVLHDDDDVDMRDTLGWHARACASFACRACHKVGLFMQKASQNMIKEIKGSNERPSRFRWWL